MKLLTYQIKETKKARKREPPRKVHDCGHCPDDNSYHRKDCPCIQTIDIKAKPADGPTETVKVTKIKTRSDHYQSIWDYIYDDIYFTESYRASRAYRRNP